MKKYSTTNLWRCPLCKSKALVRKEFNSNWGTNLYRGYCVKKCDEKTITFGTKDYSCAVELWNSFVQAWSKKNNLKILG